MLQYIPDLCTAQQCNAYMVLCVRSA